MTKKLFCILLVALLAVPAGCGAGRVERYEFFSLDLFDTAVILTAYCKSETEGNALYAAVMAELAECDRQFDIYDKYDGVNNLAAVNEAAGTGPVAVDERIIDLLLFAKEAYALTDGRVNAAMGAVLTIWHESRAASRPRLPDMAALEAAAAHTNINDIIIDAAAGTVELTDPLMRIDVGAIAKGYASDRALALASAMGANSVLLNLGGNVMALGERPDGPWRVGIADPDNPEEKLFIVELSGGALVTSGDYERFVEIGGVRYGHIIDPATLMSAHENAQTTVKSESGALADALSTALFMMQSGEGLALAQTVGAEACVVGVDGEIEGTEYFSFKK